MRAHSVLFPALFTLACGSQAKPTPDGAVLRFDTAAPSPEDAVALDTPAQGVGDASYPLTFATWPGDSTIVVASAKNAFGDNLSGLFYEPAASGAILWAVQNEPAKIHRLGWDGSVFARVPTDGWVTGKSLRYPGGVGSPDSEGLTRTDGSSTEMYVVAERDNENKEISRQSILRYDLAGTKGILDATHEWDLTGDLPVFESNSGLEGIAWVPDTDLVARGFFDESTQTAYDPSVYANHGTGLFFVSVDATGMIYAYALDHVGNTAARIASFHNGQARGVDLSYDRDQGVLWSLCDNKCDGRVTLFEIETDPAASHAGRFVLRATLTPPKAIWDLNVEGIALAPDSECVNNRKPIVWADDQETNGYAIRKGTIACGRFF
jgi:hypothetical protein